MAKVLIAYHSSSGNTEKMAKAIEKGAKKAGAEVTLKRVDALDVDDLLDYDAIIVGSPTYYGSMAANVKKMFDDSVKFHGKLEGKVGAAFTSSANIGGGNETVIRGILDALLIHGMIIQGNHQGDHYGPVSIGSPDPRVEKQCVVLGERTAQLADRLK